MNIYRAARAGCRVTLAEKGLMFHPMCSIEARPPAVLQRL